MKEKTAQASDPRISYTKSKTHPHLVGRDLTGKNIYATHADPPVKAVITQEPAISKEDK